MFEVALSSGRESKQNGGKKEPKLVKDPIEVNIQKVAHIPPNIQNTDEALVEQYEELSKKICYRNDPDFNINVQENNDMFAS